MIPNADQTTSRCTPDDIPRLGRDRGDCVLQLGRHHPRTEAGPMRPLTPTAAGLGRQLACTGATSRTLLNQNEPSTAKRGCRRGAGEVVSPLHPTTIGSRTSITSTSIISLPPLSLSPRRRRWNSENRSKTPHRWCRTPPVFASRSPPCEWFRADLDAEIVEVHAVTDLLRRFTHGFSRSEQRTIS